MSEAVTIDQYDPSVHERYAIDQSRYDPAFLQSAGEIPAHLEIAASEAVIASKYEELFKLGYVGAPFASFFPPPKYRKMRNRFFKHSISPDFDWDVCEEDEDIAEELKEQLLAQMSALMPIALFEQDRSSLVDLIDSITLLNGWLKHVHARRLQYQKG